MPVWQVIHAFANCRARSLLPDIPGAIPAEDTYADHIPANGAVILIDGRNDRVDFFLLIHFSGFKMLSDPTLAKNMGWEYDASKITIPYFMIAGTGKSDDSGNDPEKGYGGVSPLSAQIANYNSIPDEVQKVRARAVRAEHEQMLMRSDGYMTAWMLYQLMDDAEAASVFIGEEAEILHNNNWQDVEKNQ